MCQELLSTSPDNDPIICFFGRPSGHGCTNHCLGLLGMSTCWAVRSNSQLTSDFTHNRITTPAAGQTLILPMPLKATIHNAMEANPSTQSPCALAHKVMLDSSKHKYNTHPMSTVMLYTIPRRGRAPFETTHATYQTIKKTVTQDRQKHGIAPTPPCCIPTLHQNTPTKLGSHDQQLYPPFLIPSNVF